MAECESLIMPMAEHIKCLINKIEEQHRLIQRLQRQFLGTIYQSPLATPKAEDRVVTPPTCTSSETDFDGEHIQRHRRHAESHNKRIHGARFTFPEGDGQKKQKSKSIKAQASE